MNVIEAHMWIYPEEIEHIQWWEIGDTLCYMGILKGTSPLKAVNLNTLDLAEVFFNA